MSPLLRVARDRRGIALITVLLITMVVAAMALTAAMVTMNGKLIRSANEKADQTNYAAYAGLEEARSALNAKPSLFPDSGYKTLENGVSVTDAAGNAIAGIKRWTYYGPIGVTGGQYGVNGAIISVTTSGPVRSVRRLDVPQETFAKYAYFTNVEGNIVFGAGDQLQGPVHSNDVIQIGSGSPKPAFFGAVTTAKTVSNSGNANFYAGLTQHSQVIPMPTIAQLASMKGYATAGGTYFNPAHPTDGGAGQATTRIQFVAIDLDGDGKTNGADEGFFKVYHSDTKPWFVVADTPTTSGKTGMRYSPNCGDYQGSHTGTFVPAVSHPSTGTHSWTASLADNSARCFLGGDSALTNGFVASDSNGAWVKYTDTPDARLTALGRADADYLFPLSRNINPNFKGVIYVDGKVAVSGIVRGRVSVVSPNNIIIADDLNQATDPSTGICDDIVGLITPADILVADNSLNSPEPKNSSGTSLKTFDDTQDEFIQAVLLTLDIFSVENYDQGSTKAEPCSGNQVGRGCLYLTGGIVQNTRGAVGLTDGHGYQKRYAYNSCAATNPPPYFPTTGVFDRGSFHEIDPANFNVSTWFAANQH